MDDGEIDEDQLQPSRKAMERWIVQGKIKAIEYLSNRFSESGDEQTWKLLKAGRISSYTKPCRRRLPKLIYDFPYYEFYAFLIGYPLYFPSYFSLRR